MRTELLAMSAASIDRYLAPAKATDQIRGVSTTKPSPLPRASIKIRKAGDEVEAEPGFFEGDTVAHCGPTFGHIDMSGLVPFGAPARARKWGGLPADVAWCLGDQPVRECGAEARR